MTQDAFFDAFFDDLRSILQRPASVETWCALCEHLDLWDRDVLEQVALPYALNIVTRWSAELERVAPERWVDVSAESIDPSLALANTLKLRPCLEAPDEAFTHALLCSPHLAQLRALSLCGALLDDAIAALAASSHLVNLIYLDLSYNDIGAAGAAALAASPSLANLEELDLSDNAIGDAGAAALAASPHLNKLTSLWLRHCGITDAGVVALAASPYFSQLRQLDMDHNKLNDAGAIALAAWPRTAKLTDLSIHHCNIGGSGVAALSASPHLAGLRSLDLRDNPITPDGHAALSASPHLRNTKIYTGNGKKR